MDDQERLAQALLERYRVEGELGSGGMATVYLARDLKHDGQVAWQVTSQTTLFDPYPDDSRYQALLRKMNLPYEPEDAWPVPLPVVHPELPESGVVSPDTGVG